MKRETMFSKKNYVLLRELVKTDFKLRYQGSILGHLWSILKPLMMFAIMYIVFVRFLKFGADIPHFAVALLLGQVIWTFFTETTTQGLQSIVSRGELLRKINFPKYIVVVAASIGALINLAINLVVVLVFAIINGVDFHWYALLAPIFIIEIYIFSLAVAFILATLYVKFRDISHIWDVVTQGAYFATPIFYPITMVIAASPLAAKILILSPVAQVIQELRYILISPANITTGQLIGNWLIALIPFILTIILVVVAFLYFHKSSKKFAEII